MTTRFFSEKYHPRNLDELTHNHQVTQLIKSIACKSDFPHMIFYGPDGAGKKTRIKILLQAIFNESVYKISVESKEFKIGSKSIFYTIANSPFHIEITPSDSGINDRHIIQYVIKEVACMKNVLGSMSTSKNLKMKGKIVLINEADKLSKEAQSALRRTMEKYMSNCRVILCCNHISKIIGPIRSRCISIRVGAPTQQEIIDILKTINEDESMHLNDKQIKDIVNSSERNTRRAINTIQLSK